MITTFDIADLRMGDVARAWRSVPRPESTPGLRSIELALAAPLGPSVLPRPSFRRLASVALWDDEDAVDRHRRDGELAGLMSGGWRVRLATTRASGSWPGLDAIDDGSLADDGGPVVALTLGRLRVRRAVPFFRASAAAEAQILGAPGLIWATGMGRPPFVGTCSLWRDADALEAFAYRDGSSPHRAAMAADRKEPFHVVSAFVRFRPYASEGGLGGTNSLRADWPGTNGALARDRG